MRIFLHELKKIWRLPILLVIVLFGSMYYYLFPAFYLNYSDNGLNTYATLKIYTDLKNEYGDELDAAERLDSEKYLDKYMSDMDKIITDNKIYADLEIYSGKDLWAYKNALDWDSERSEEEWQEFNEHYSMIMNLAYDSAKYDYPAWKIQELERFFELYESYSADDFTAPWKHMSGLELNQAKEKLLQKYYDESAYTVLFPDELFIMTSDYFEMCAVIMIISVAIIILPVLTKDKHSNMPAMQYSSKAGKKLLRTQFGAAITSAFVLAVIELAVFIALFFYTNQDYSPFFGLPVFSKIWVSYLPWFNLIYMQYVAVFAGLALFLTMGTAALCFLLSMHSKEYISMILKALPILAVLFFINIMIMRYPLTLANFLYYRLPVIGIEFYVCAVILIIGFALCSYSYQRVKQKDLV